MNTNTNYITDWTAIHTMRFNQPRTSGVIGERIYIPAGTIIVVDVGRKTFSFKVNEPTWSDLALPAIRKTEKYILSVAHYNHLYLDRVEKAIKAGKDKPKWNLKIMFTYTGRALPKKERQPLRPLTKEQEEELKAQIRAKRGLV